MFSKVWDEIIRPFSNFTRAAVEVWEWVNDFTQHLKVDVITNPWCH